MFQGLFDKGIGQSGSALSPWAFDFHGSLNGRNMAALAGCTSNVTENDDEIAQCLIDLPYDEMMDAYSEYKVILEFFTQPFSAFK